MNQHPQWPAQHLSPPPQKVPRLYNWKVLAALVLLYIASVVLFSIASAETNGTSSSNEPIFVSILQAVGIGLLFTIHATIIVMDGANFFTLNGKIQWRSLKGWSRLGLGLIYCSGWVMPAIYLVLDLQYAWKVKRLAKIPNLQVDAGGGGVQQRSSHPQGTPISQPEYIPPQGVTTESENKPMRAHSQQRTKVFISYSHHDMKYLQRLQTHFAHYERLGIVEVWDDTKLTPGALWQGEMKNALRHTKAALLLISADYLASQFIAENELPPLLLAAQTEGATIIPVILSACAFEASELAKFQAVNNPMKPLSSMSWDEKEKVWATVAKLVSTAMNSYWSLNTPHKNAVPLLERKKAFEQETTYAQQLVLEQPKGWEYLLTAELLHSKLMPIKRRLLDLKSGSVYQRSLSMRGDQFFEWAQVKCNDFSSLIRFATNILNSDIPASWGPPGIAGEPLAIKQAVERLIDVCDEMLKREVEIHFIIVPNSLVKLKQAMEGWSTEFISEIERIPAQLAAPFAQSNPSSTINIQLVFREPASMRAFNSEIRKIEAKVRRHGKKILSS